MISGEEVYDRAIWRHISSYIDPHINVGIRLKEDVPFVEQCSIASEVSFPCGSSQFMFHIEWVCHCSTCSAVYAIATYSAGLTQTRTGD